MSQVTDMGLIKAFKLESSINLVETRHDASADAFLGE